MVDTVALLPDAPTRAGGVTQAQYVAQVDPFLAAWVAFVPQFNGAIGQFNASLALVAQWKTAAVNAADRAEAAGGFRVASAAASWADLAAIVGTYDGQSAGVFGDAGTHTDPVTGDEDVANTGRYAWSVAEQGWRWIDDGSAGSVNWSEIVGKPETFEPSDHEHSIGDVDGLESALGAKAAAGAVGASGLTAAAGVLIGRFGDTAGALQQISLGDGLTLDAEGTLSVDGGAGTVPSAGIVVSTGSAYGASLAIPTGSLVGTTASQTLKNKTFGEGTSITDGTASGLTLTGGTIQAGVTVSDTGTVAATSPGFRGAPPITGTTRTLALTDAGKLIHVSGNVTIPANSAVPFPIGTIILLSNSSSSNSTVSINSNTLRLAGTTDTGSVVLARYGLAALVKTAATEWKIVGNVS